MKTMKTLCGVYVGDMKDPNPETRGKVALVDLPFPELGPQDVRIKVAYCAICGSDPIASVGVLGRSPARPNPSRWAMRFPAWWWNWDPKPITRV